MTTAPELFNVNELRKLSTPEQVEKYFNEAGIITLEHKVSALTQAIGAKDVDYLGKVSLDNQYQSLLTLFTDDEFRWLKGIF